MSRAKPITVSEARDRLTLRVSEAAYLASMSPSKMYSALERAEVPGLRRVGGRVLVNAEEFLAFFEKAS